MKFYMLPFPPSVNNLFLNVRRGRVKTPQYRAWIEEAGLLLNQQHVPRYEGKVFITFRVNRPDKRKRDLDNICKAPIDLLVASKIIEDDSLIDGFEIKWEGEGYGMFFAIRTESHQ
jgi:crossover junction endodeoxyribonuclease RusA